MGLPARVKIVSHAKKRSRRRAADEYQPSRKVRLRDKQVAFREAALKPRQAIIKSDVYVRYLMP